MARQCLGRDPVGRGVQPHGRPGIGARQRCHWPSQTADWIIPAYNAPMPPSEFPRLDRTRFSAADLSSGTDDRAYWLSKDYRARLEAVELSRQAVYGYDPASTRLQRVLEIAQLARG